MSYSSELKKELYQTIPDKKEAKYLIAGVIMSDAHFDFNDDSISFQVDTENPDFARYIFRLIYKYYRLKGSLSYLEQKRFRKHKLYTLTYIDTVGILKKLGCVKLLDKGYYSPILNEIVYKSDSDKRAFLKGVFLSSGFILNPERSYHVEIDTYNEAVIETCADILTTFDIDYILNRNRSKISLVIKDAESIADFLGLIGAHKQLFKFEDLMIYKEMRGNINRKINFETANLNKQAQASSKVIKAIRVLQKEKKYSSLSNELKEVAELRVNHPSASLNRLVELSSKKISRSTLNRRLKQLVEMSKEDDE